MRPDLPQSADVVIVGGGPAGLAAATWLRRSGVARVVVLDREPVAGGIPRHCGHYPYGLREFRRLMRGPDYAARLVRRAQEAGVQVLTGVAVLSVEPGPVVTLTSDAGLTRISAQRVLLATGVRETSRAARLIGGTKPGGVLSTGALQGMVYLDHLRPFQRPVILGSELVAMSAIMTCRHMGIRPVAMIEPGARVTARWPSGLFPRMMGIPLHLNTSLQSIEGRDQVTGVFVRGPGGKVQRLDCDGVIITGQFRPEASVLQASHITIDPGTRGPQVDEFGRTSDPTVFAAGNLLRAVETAGACWAEGIAVAKCIALSLQSALPNPSLDKIIAVKGTDLAYVMPQRVSATQIPPAFADLQMRVTKPAKGQIVMSSDGQARSGHSVNALPERRVTLPLPRDGSTPITVTFERG